MLKFDLFEAIRIMKERLGAVCEISVSPHDLGYQVRLTEFSRGGRSISKQFIVSYRELTDANVCIMNEKFNENIRLIERHISDKAS